MRLLLIVFTVTLVMFGCSRKVSTSGTAAAGNYAEDLSVWRPETTKAADSVESPNPERIRTNKYVEATYAINDEVDMILDSVYEQNLSKGFVDGYTIQIYSGTKREDALTIKKKLSQSLPDLESDVQYRQPNFRVRSGKYFTRLEAQKDYLAVRRYFPNAIVIPDRIPIN
jgi:hypothetical protein